jgi:hypothetical protein
VFFLEEDRKAFAGGDHEKTCFHLCEIRLGSEAERDIRS